jgi:hypothetical protein
MLEILQSAFTVSGPVIALAVPILAVVIRRHRKLD